MKKSPSTIQGEKGITPLVIWKMIDDKIIGFEVFAKEYAERFDDVSHYEFFLKQFVSLLDHGSKIVDIACGPGNITGFLLKCRNDLQIECVDISPAMIEMVKERFPVIDCHICDIKNYALKKSHYEGVICSFGLPFLSREEIIGFLANIFDGLKKSGIVYLSTMKGNSEGFETTSFSGDLDVYFIYHDKDFLDAAIEAAGFRIIEYHEQLFPQQSGEDLVDMIYILKKCG